jgi:hypothetical protein
MSATKRTAAPVNDDTTSMRSSQTFTIPSTAAAGDIIFFGMAQGTGANTFTAPSGWTSMGGPTVTNSNLTSQVWAKKLVSGDPGSVVTFTATSGAWSVAAYIIISGADLLSEVRAGTALTGTSGNPVATPTVTTTETDNFVLEMVFVRSALATQVTLAPGSGLTEDAECNTNSSGSPNFAMGIYHATANSGAIGSYGGHSVTANQAITASQRYTFAVTSSTTPPPASTDPGLRVSVIMDDGTLRKVTVYAVKSDGTLAQLTNPA